MTKNNFPNVWYASEEKIKSASKRIVFDNAGSFNISESKLEFKGGGNYIQIEKSNIKNILITKQKINWITYAIINISLILWFFFVYVFSVKSTLTFVVILLVLNGFGLLINTSTKWILIEFNDQNGNLKKAYFANGSLLGWSGIFGGTQKLYHSIKLK